METNKLQSMTSFVLGEIEILKSKEPLVKGTATASLFYSSTIRKIENYAKFLSTPLSIGQFIPCGLDGLPLVEPKRNTPVYSDFSGWVDDFDVIEVEEYNAAQGKVLFDGFAIKDGLSVCDENSILNIFWNYEGEWKLSHGIFTIEDLVKYNITLTPYALTLINK